MAQIGTVIGTSKGAGNFKIKTGSGQLIFLFNSGDLPYIIGQEVFYGSVKLIHGTPFATEHYPIEATQSATYPNCQKIDELKNPKERRNIGRESIDLRMNDALAKVNLKGKSSAIFYDPGYIPQNNNGDQPFIAAGRNRLYYRAATIILYGADFRSRDLRGPKEFPRSDGVIVAYYKVFHERMTLADVAKQQPKKSDTLFVGIEGLVSMKGSKAAIENRIIDACVFSIEFG